jgi:16S rRNA (uracil1498-N3)-methyltransferase
VLDGAGHEYVCEAAELARNTIRLSVRQTKSVAPLPYQVTLVQAIPKGKTLDAIIQKATELGVFAIVPLLSERVVLRLDEEKFETKADHWRAIAVEAIKQCGSAWLPRVEPPTPFRTLLSRVDKFDLTLIASLQPGSRHPRAWFNAFQHERKQMPRSVCLWVGPEGDFTPEEVMAAESAGARPITLGRLVLRSETAALYSLSVVIYELQYGS